MKKFVRYGYPEQFDKVNTLRNLPLEYKQSLVILFGLWGLDVLDCKINEKEVTFVDPHKNTLQYTILKTDEVEYWVSMNNHTISLYCNTKPYNQMTLSIPSYGLAYEEGTGGDTERIMESLEAAMHTLVVHSQLTKDNGYLYTFYEINSIVNTLGLTKEFNKRLAQLGYQGEYLECLKRENRSYAYEEWQKDGLEL
jgi:hypothetical protein